MLVEQVKWFLIILTFKFPYNSAIIWLVKYWIHVINFDQFKEKENVHFSCGRTTLLFNSTESESGYQKEPCGIQLK